MSTAHQDTIVAIATPPGEGAVGIVRLSGPAAVDVASRCVSFKPSLHRLEHNRIQPTRLVLRGRETDEILVFVSRAPRSYTGEDTVELQCHGSPALLNRLVRVLVAAGARQAEPGEFTKRAFLNGRIDLTQAEAVADLVAARTDVGLESAYFQLRGGLRRRFEDLSEELRQTKTLIEAELDFSEDVALDPAAVATQLRRATDILARQIGSYRTGKLIRGGARVTLAGAPNVGKSSLLNALIGQERAIVTDIPGTTRDTIEESIQIDGIEVILTDTAGIRDSDDPVEREGTRRSSLALESADLVVVVKDGSRPPADADRLDVPGDPVIALNKSDLGIHEGWEGTDYWGPVAVVSALTGEGLDDLRSAIRERLLQGGEVGAEGITNERHYLALCAARDALTRAEESVREGSPGEIISLEIDEGLTALAGIIGETTAQDILDRVFSRFCIGK